MSKEEMPKAYEPASIEEKWYSTWENNRLVHGEPKPGKKPYSIVIPPPNVTGILTMGHVLNNTLQDILIRWHRMRGEEVCWFPGTDHAGIATESKVDKVLREKEGIDRRTLGREKFIERVWEWKKQYGGTRILKNTDAETRKALNQLLLYPEDSAGSIMTPEYVSLYTTMTVEQAFDRIRKEGVDKETIYTCYVTENRKLVGVVSVRSLLVADKSTLIGDIMHQNLIAVETTDDKEFVASQFQKYGYLAIPVVDKENRLVGIVTIDDALDVMEDEATEDIEKMAAIVPSEKPYMKTGVFATYAKRIPWLLLLMISATFTSQIINSFETALKACILLTGFIPMIMDTGGNAGGQASVTIIRGLSVGDVELRDVWRIIWKEVRVAAVCGLTIAPVAFLKVLLVDRMLWVTEVDGNPVNGIMIALVVSLTLMFTIVISKFIGCTLPLLAKKIGFDPAVMASPFITTIVDALSLLLYFGVARTILGI